jgi:putative membrane protein
MGTGGMGMGMGWMWIFGLLVIIGIVLLVVVVVRAMGGGISRGDRGSATTPGRSRAREVLDERYARGELSSEEYRERLQGLGENT